VHDVSEIYNACSLYVQPSASEGFGIEVLEALAHGRRVVCSAGAGAADVVHGWVVPARDVHTLAKCISAARARRDFDPHALRKQAANYTWDKIRAQYQDLWRSL
jgi:glycosyltransferase involved in cell wall biosynthesis